MENFSEFSAAQRNAGKHVTLMSELSRLVDARTLMQVWGMPSANTLELAMHSSNIRPSKRVLPGSKKGGKVGFSVRVFPLKHIARVHGTFVVHAHQPK